jgi:hypothetical protein
LQIRSQVSNVGGTHAGLELPILPDAYADEPRGATDAEPPTFAIASEYLGER